MMRFYQEIELIETPEITPYFIWGRLYMQVHLALVELQNPDKTVNVGVSFPEYKTFKKDGVMHGTIGNKLRLFAASESKLQQLNLNKWLDRLTDYVKVSKVKPVPDNINHYAIVSRYRANTNLERITRRFMKRKSKKLGRELSFAEAKQLQNERYADKHQVSIEEAEKHYQQPKVQEFPFIKLKSESTGNEFSLQINQKIAEQAQPGSFNTYGLSSKTTVPIWD